MRILMVHFHSAVTGVACSVRASAMQKYFARQGHRVTVATTPSTVCGDGASDWITVPYRPLLPGWGLVTRAVNRLCYLPEPEQAWTNDVLKALEARCRQGAWDAVLVSTPPHAVQRIGVEIRRRHGLRYVADFRDDWVTADRYRVHTPVHRWSCRRYERMVVDEADTVILNTPIVRRRFQERYPHQAEKLVTIPNGYDEEHFASSGEPMRNDFDGGRKVVFYGGNSYRGYVRGKIEETLQALDRLGVADEWLFVTAGETFDVSLEWRNHWMNLGRVDQTHNARLLVQADLLLLAMPPGEGTPSGTVPLKTYGYLRTGKPIVYIGESGATTDVLSEFPGTYCLPRQDWALLGLWMHRHHGELGRQYDRPGVGRYDFAVLTRRVAELLAGDPSRNTVERAGTV